MNDYEISIFDTIALNVMESLLVSHKGGDPVHFLPLDKVMRKSYKMAHLAMKERDIYLKGLVPPEVEDEVLSRPEGE